MIKGNLALCIGFYNSSWGFLFFGWKEWALKSWSKYLVLCFWHVLCFFLSLHPYCWARVTCWNWMVPSPHVLLLLVLSWCIQGFWLQLQGALRFRPGCSEHVSVILHSQCLWLRGWAVCACSNKMRVNEWEHEIGLSSLVKQFPGELVTFFFKKFILIEMKEKFNPWGYYWEVLLNFTQFSAISFAAFKMMNPRHACGVTDQHNALLQCDFCMNCMVPKKEGKCSPVAEEWWG